MARAPARLSLLTTLLFALGGAQAAIFTAGCATGDGMQTKLYDATNLYNRSLRWGDFDRAAQYLPIASREVFLTRSEDLSEELVIVDYELKRLKLDKETGIAASRFEISWHTDRMLIVSTTIIDQTWQFHEGNFVLVDEHRASGKPLAIFAEKEEEQHPYLPGLEAYRKAYEIGEENKKRGRRKRGRRGDAEAT